MEASDDILMLRYAYKLPSVRWLAAANLLAMLLAYFFGGLRELTAVYWWEMLIIWVFSFARLAVVSPLYLLAVSPLLLLMAGFTMLVFTHMLSYVGNWDPGSKQLTLSVPFAAGAFISAIPLIFSHAYSFCKNFWPDRGSYRGPKETASINYLVYYPFKRAAGWGIVVLLSFAVAGSLGAVWLAFVFIGFFKIAADIWTHVTLNDLAKAAQTMEARGRS